MTEVQGAMSDLIARIAHPEEVLTRSNAQHAELVGLLRKRDAAKAVAVDPHPHPRHRAHPRRPALSGSGQARSHPTSPTSPSGGSSSITPTPRA